jgi:dTDP-4-dehydrorhamnose reductase
MKILLTGVTGQVGFELQTALTSLGEVIALTRQELDLADAASIISVLNHYQPDIIVNPAAYTAVDKAESESETAYQVNQFAPQIMAEWAAKHDALLIHYSTDYVFDGTKESAYNENDLTHPQSVYGRSKCLGEEAIRATTARHLILRTSWIFGIHGNNFIKTILRLAKERESLTIVADQWGAPTSAELIAELSALMIQRYVASPTNFNYGTYHLSAHGATTWYDYARYIVQLAIEKQMPLTLTESALHPIPSSAYPVPAVRPANSR